MKNEQDYRIGTARKMLVDTDSTPDLLKHIQQKLCIVQFWYGSLSKKWNGSARKSTVENDGI